MINYKLVLKVQAPSGELLATEVATHSGELDWSEYTQAWYTLLEQSPELNEVIRSQMTDILQFHQVTAFVSVVKQLPYVSSKTYTYPLLTIPPASLTITTSRRGGGSFCG